MSERKSWNHGHRAGKTRFDAALSDEEQALVDEALDHYRCTKKELLILGVKCLLLSSKICSSSFQKSKKK